MPFVLPDAASIRRYSQQDLRSDVFAGLTVAAISIPQAIAYALIAGVPPAFGLYTGIVTCIVGSLLRSSSHLITGPTNATAMIIGSVIHQGHFKPEQTVEMVLLLTFLVGVIQLGFGLLRLSGVVRYISYSVVAGITAGAGVLIAGNQLLPFFGLQDAVSRADMRVFVVGLARTLAAIAEHVLRWELPVWPALIGSGTIVFILLTRKRFPWLPGPLTAIVGWALLIRLLGWHVGTSPVQTVGHVGEIPRSLYLFHIPGFAQGANLSAVGTLFPGALAVAILGLIEAIATARALSSRSGQRVDFTREFVGQGAANLVGSFFQCFAGSGSFTRSAVNFQSGARTRMAGVWSGVFTALVVVAFAPLANWIPTASLAGLLMLIAMQMVDRNTLHRVWNARGASRVVFLVTFGATILLGLKYAIFIGVFASIVFLLRATSEPGITRIVAHPNGDIEELPLDSTTTAQTPVALIDLSGDLYFAAVQDLDLKLKHSIPPETRALILRVRQMRLMGSTGAEMLSKFCRAMRDMDIAVIFAGVEPEFERLLARSGLREEIGEENIFYADSIVFRSTQLAVARAQALARAGAELDRRGSKTIDSPAESSAPATAASGVAPLPTAAELMRQDAIRFGVDHHLREAVWLLREARRHRRRIERLFLQGEQGGLAGSVDMRLILRILLEHGKRVAGTETFGGEAMIRRAWARIHRLRLRALAETGHVTVPPAATAEEVIEAMVTQNAPVIPVTRDGRVLGLIHAKDVARLLAQRLETHERS